MDICSDLWYNLIMNTTDKITYPYSSVTTDTLFARRQEILSLLPGFDLAHVMRASLITRSVKCGKPNCRCANGEGHKSLYLSSYYNGKTRLDSVPKSYKDKISKSIRDYDELIDLLSELSSINLELFRRRELDF
jgi:hypothetical protein